MFPLWNVIIDNWKYISKEEAVEYCHKNTSDIKIKINSKEWNVEYLKSINIEDSTNNSNNNKANIVMNVGGPSWNSDWLYTEEENQYLALSVNNSLEHNHIFGKKYTGKNMIQIWHLDFNNNKHYFALGIGHNGSAITDLKWCPNTFIKGKRLGILATADYNCNLSIYSIPIPDINTTTLPICVPAPLVTIKCDNVIRKIIWSYTSDSNFIWLLAGTENGSIMSWNFNINSEIEHIESLLPIFNVSAHSSFITSIVCSPLNPNIIATSSYDALFKIWDIRNPYRPLYTHQIGGGYVTHSEWGKFGLNYLFPFLILAMEDSSVRLFNLEVGSSKGLIEEDSDVPINSVSLNCKRGYLATASSQGYLEIFDVGRYKSSKRRNPEVPYFKLSLLEKDGVYIFDSAPHKATTATTSSSKKNAPKNPEQRSFTEFSLAALRVQYNPNEMYSNWLLASCSMGIVLLKNCDKL